ncbi:MAG: agmatinase [Chloroflexi bacterium]|nr:agmatinase [Chloroflexota bacterium]
MNRAADRLFLGAAAEPCGDAVVLGAPLDVTESFLAGTSMAPRTIRAVSDVLETYSPILRRDLSDLDLVDWGDVAFPPQDVTAALTAIDQAVNDARGAGFPLLIGGEHTVTLGAVRGIQRRYPELFVIQLDAHLDLRDVYGALPLSHATVMRRVADAIGFDHLVQAGVRSGTREEFELACQCLASGFSLELAPEVRKRIAASPIYLTIDIDVLDPAFAPGTGCPEPGGSSFTEVVDFLYSLADLNVVAADVVEVLPTSDVNNVTSVAAAKLIRELALLFAAPCG